MVLLHVDSLFFFLFYECKKIGFQRHSEGDDNPRLWNRAPCCGMSNAGDIKTLDKMQNVGYTCHLHPGITRTSSLQCSAANRTAAGDVSDCFLELSASWSSGAKVILHAMVLFHHPICKCSILCQRDCGDKDANPYPMTELIHLTDAQRPDI